MKSSASATGLFALTILATLYVADDLLVPIAFAMLLNLLFFPLVRALQRYRIPSGLSAGVIVLMLVGLFVLLGNLLSGPAQEWLAEAPRTIRALQSEMFAAQDQFAGIRELADEVDQLAISDSASGAQAVVVQEPGLIDDLVGGLPSFVTFTGIVVFLTYFLLAAGDTLLRRATQFGRTFSERRRIVAICRQVQADLSRYLTTVTVINLCLGALVAAAMQVLDVPNPMLWGAMAAIFNFAPYVGALASTSVLTIVSLTTFDSLAEAVIVPLAFFAMTVIEGQLITPAVIGRRLSMSPIFVFLAVVVWGWIWGIAGALMAIPIVTTLKIVCDHVPRWQPIGRFLRSDRHELATSRPAARRFRPKPRIVHIPSRRGARSGLILPRTNPGRGRQPLI